MFRVYGAFFSFLLLFCVHAWAQEESTEEQISLLSNELLLPLAQEGNAEAQYHLGLSYHFSGDGAVAKKWLEAAAKQNNIDAMFLLSDSDYSPTSKDKHHWYEKLAELGNSQGMMFNAIQYEEDKNYRQAYVWFVLASRVLSEKLTSCQWGAPECYDPTYQGMMEKLSMRLSAEERQAALVEADELYRSIANK